jgi:dipeptidyl aminopeptidase/acylaminoacyl peptidase
MMQRWSTLIFTLTLSFGLSSPCPAANPGAPEAVQRVLDEDGRVVLERSGVVVEVFDQSVNGRRIEALRFSSVSDERTGGVVLVPGYGRTARDYLALGARCAAAGYVCIAVSQPGFGNSEGPPDFAGPATITALERVLSVLRADPAIDPARIAVYGYSRGALAAATLATLDRQLAAVILAAGIYDFQAAYDQVQIEGIRANMLAETGMTPDAIAARSPLHHAEQITAPVLIIHGQNDINAPPEQAQQLHEVLHANGKPVELHLVPDHAHGLPLTIVVSLMLEFLERHLTPANQAMPIANCDRPADRD